MTRTLQPPATRRGREDSGGRRQWTALAAAAALVVAAVVGVALVRDYADDDGDVLRSAAPPGSEVVDGLPQLPDYPVEVAIPPGLEQTPEPGATLVLEPAGLPEGAGTIFLSALRSLAVTGVNDEVIPDDVAAFLSQRDDLVITDVQNVEVGGVEGQSFTLRVAENRGARDVWCAVQDPLCFKPLPGSPMQVVVLPTPAQPLWIAIEYRPEYEAQVRAAADELLDSLVITD